MMVHYVPPMRLSSRFLEICINLCNCMRLHSYDETITSGSLIDICG